MDYTGTFDRFSSPLRGISISTTEDQAKEWLEERFRPLFGVPLFLHIMLNSNVFYTHVFVPSTGYLYFYEDLKKLEVVEE